MASIYWARDTDNASIKHKKMEQPVKFSGQLSVGPLQAYATLIAFLVSGFLGLVYEIAWSRTLILLFGTSVYAFATMLTTYLIGLALGSLCMSRWSDRNTNPLLAFAVIHIIIGSAIFVTTPLLGQLPHFFIDLFQIDTSWRVVTLTEFAACFAIMFVPAFGSGALFPLAARIFIHQRQFHIGRTIADAYAFNTLGAIAGSFVAGFLLIPWIGMEKTLLAGAGVNMAVASGLIICSQQIAFGKKALAAAILLLVAGIGFVTLQTWVPLAMSSGVYVYGDALAKTRSKSMVSCVTIGCCIIAKIHRLQLL